MKRFRRWVFNGLAAMSLLFFLATVGLWLESEFAADGGFRADSASQFTVESGTGEISFSFIRLQNFLGQPTPGLHFFHDTFHRWWPDSLGGQYVRGAGYPQEPWDRLGFHFLYRSTSPQWVGTVWLISVPFWFLVCVFSVLPVIQLRRSLLRRHQLRDRLCSNCGYDLRATPDRCPECGTIQTKP